ncbi:hypothetical protein FRC05_007350 [Tulasnella sp. 425]|nr:hypothetical protein FRC05_007350 [Tulasnella sp. 425]
MRVKGGDIVLIIVAILFPPLAVFLMTALLSNQGHIHAFWLIYKKMKAEETYGPGGYKYTGSGVYAPVYGTAPATAATAPQVENYGTTGATVPPPVVDGKTAY